MKRVKAQEISRDLGLSQTVVYRMLQQGQIPNIRAGKLYIVSRTAYEEWLRTCGMPRPAEALQ